MNSSRVGLIFVIVVIFSFGWQAKPSEASEDACHRVDVLFSYLDIERYNKSYPYVDYMAVVKPILDHMFGRVSGVIDSYADIIMYWVQVCRAKDPEAEIAAWKELAYELNHRMFTDESFCIIIKKLFGDEMVGRVMNPPNPPLYSRLNPLHAPYLACVDRVGETFVQHCGLVCSFYALKYIDTLETMCSLGVNEREFEMAASETCKGNVYVSKLASD
ncbi:hypothetical protein vseg_003772 [Gypsophila vaccaria]